MKESSLYKWWNRVLCVIVVILAVILVWDIGNTHGIRLVLHRLDESGYILVECRDLDNNFLRYDVVQREDKE